MECSPTSMGLVTTGVKMIEELAKEELEILEAQYPDGFECMKLELKSFIFLLQSNNSISTFPTSSSATTQASSTSRKRKKCSSEVQKIMEGGAGQYCKQKLQKRDRIDVVIERAQACLHKIQQFKTSFHIS